MRAILSLLLLLTLSSAAAADTIYLKNGSVIKGKVTGFADDQFTVLLDAGGRYQSRATIYMGDVSRIEFDSAPAQVSDSSTREAAPPPKSQPETPHEVPTREPQPKETSRNADTVEPPRVTLPPETSTQPPATEPEKPAEKPLTPPLSEPSESEPRKPASAARTQSVDVAAKRDWTSTQILINRGDRIVITATGTISLDTAGSKTSGPEGIDFPDSKKLMVDQPTGGLIAVIGADNDDFIFIGRGTEFTATRGGLLFLSVNDSVLSDNGGSYKAVIEVYTSQKNK